MAGMSVPVVMVPRFTTLCGTVVFETMAMDVSRYSGAELTVWRGEMAGTTPTFTVTCEESTDGTEDPGSWTVCTGGSANTIAENVQEQLSITFVKRLFRIKIALAATGIPVASCWINGFFVQRIS